MTREADRLIQPARKTLVVVGAGPLLGMAVARRFGREGYRVGLIARSREKLDRYVTDLESLAIEAAGFAADVNDHPQLLDAIGAIAARFGRIDAVEYSPMISNNDVQPVLNMDLSSVRRMLDYYLLGPLVVVNAVLDGMLKRGEGALLFTSGASGVGILPSHGNVSLAMGGLRQYVRMLNASLAHRGVYAGSILIAKPHDPDELADMYWSMVSNRDRVEEVYGTIELSEAYEMLVARGFGPGFPPGLTVALPAPRDEGERRMFLLGLYQAKINAHWHADPVAAEASADLEARRLGGQPTAEYYGVRLAETVHV